MRAFMSALVFHPAFIYTYTITQARRLCLCGLALTEAIKKTPFLGSGLCTTGVRRRPPLLVLPVNVGGNFTAYRPLRCRAAAAPGEGAKDTKYSIALISTENLVCEARGFNHEAYLGNQNSLIWKGQHRTVPVARVVAAQPFSLPG